MVILLNGNGNQRVFMLFFAKRNADFKLDKWDNYRQLKVQALDNLEM